MYSNITSRDASHSKTLYRLQCLSFINELKKNTDIDCILTSDPILARTLRNYYKVQQTSSWLLYSTKRIVNQILQIIQYSLWCVGAFSSKNRQRAQSFYNTSDSIVVDSFIAKKCERYQDRYYGHVFKRLPKDVQNRTFFLPQYLPFPRKRDCDNIADKSDENIIFIFDFLTAWDYLKSIFYTFYYRKHSYKSIWYKGLPLRHVLRDASIKNYSYYFCSTVLYKQLLEHLSKKTKISLIIDWFENQSYDKSLCYNVKKYMPNTAVHGFIGFMPDFSVTPHNLATNSELAHHIAHEKLFVCNQAIKDVYTKAGYRGKIFLAPTFRTQNVFNFRSYNCRHDVFTLLVPLGVEPYEVNYKISFFMNLFKAQGTHEIKILFKPHPVYPLISTEKWPANMEIINGNIYDAFSLCDAIISVNSTAMYEALASGIPVISIHDDKGLLSIEIPNNVPVKLWYNASCLDEFLEAVEYIKGCNKEELVSWGNRVKSYYFVKETPDIVNSLFGINNHESLKETV
jgi:hypothetical protein